MKKVLSVLALVGGVLGFYACEKVNTVDDDCDGYKVALTPATPEAVLEFQDIDGNHLDKELLDSVLFYSLEDTLFTKSYFVGTNGWGLRMSPTFFSDEREYYFSLVAGDIDTLKITTEKKVSKCYTSSSITSLGYNGVDLEMNNDGHYLIVK